MFNPFISFNSVSNTVVSILASKLSFILEATTASSICSFILALSLCIFVLCAFVNIPLSPVNVAIVTPASIKSTIIVITKAINVTPFLLFTLSFKFCFICFLPSEQHSIYI